MFRFRSAGAGSVWTRTFMILLALSVFFRYPSRLARAQFGIPRPKSADTEGGDSTVVPLEEEIAAAHSDMIGDLTKDPELADAMQMFAEMSPEEMQELMAELVGILGDDPTTIQAMQEVMEDLASMQPGDFKQALQGMLDDRHVADAVDETLLQLAEANEEMLDTILEKADTVLDSVIESGHLTEEEIVRFKSDPEAWKNELRAIWADLQEQASGASALDGEL